MKARWWIWSVLAVCASACGDDSPATPSDAAHGGAAGKGVAGADEVGGAGGAVNAGGAADTDPGGHPGSDNAGRAGRDGQSGRGGSAARAGTGGTHAHGSGRGGSDSGSGGDDDAGESGTGGGAGELPAPTYPQLLSETGLYSDIEASVLADDVREYHPAYELWSDGATKQRWVQLPAGMTIDTSDMDFWQYPLETKLFKEFSVDGTRIETRMLHKQRGGWAMISYLWNEEQTQAVAVPNGQLNARGTTHDVPSRSTCAVCHGKMRDIALGFTALQLSHDGGGGVTLDSLVSDGRLSSPPAHTLAIPGDDAARAALGYLHANCGICHNDHSFVSEAVDVKFWLTAASLGTVEATPTFVTAVGKEPLLGLSGADAIIEPGAPLASSVVLRMQLRGDEDQMPPVATQVVDTAGVTAVSAWIEALE